MGSMLHQLVGSYNARNAALRVQHRRAIEAAKLSAEIAELAQQVKTAADVILSRSDELCLLASVRAPATLRKVYETLTTLASLGRQFWH